MNKETLGLLGFGLKSIPMIAWVTPRVLQCDELRTEIVVPLNFRTKNHLGSVYFGALAVGADIAAGLYVMNRIRSEKLPVSLVFSDFKAKFLKRAMADTHFVTDEGQDLKGFLDRVMASSERLTTPVKMSAFCPSLSSTEKVAEFELGLSLKRSSK